MSVQNLVFVVLFVLPLDAGWSSGGIMRADKYLYNLFIFLLMPPADHKTSDLRFSILMSPLSTPL